MATITINKQIEVTEEVDVKKILISMGESRDINSTKFNISYDGIPIGYGHLNNRTNFAHINLEEFNDDLEDIIVEGVENRTIKII